MQLGVLLAVLFLSSMALVESSKTVKGRRQKRRSTEVSPVCTKGCDKCSESNGCLQCSPKLFILLERNDIRQIGICLPSCPAGYFGVRNPDMMNKCIKCKIENCEACFSRNFCTKCKDGLYLHKGRCYSTCPEGFPTANGTMECSSSAQCEMSEWGPWGPCSKKRKVCGFKKGTEERSRKVLQVPLGDLTVCPATTESRKCTVQKVPCPGENRGRSRNGRIQEKREKNGNRNSKDTKDGKKKQKGKQRGTAAPETTASPTQ
ncbi:R-spondin-1 [Rhinatrema bivittatum]|uniref:R-spondin-1 n=1 Tax=Rhinatrema bivittatum TaxID=194408 RepID=UPI0011279443|nr:R-spondin-1 [Rhinatrema bivittatum]XP_029427292.1 R-spondin-1 [Rhinatrema bivittatum]XP_029427293.1 R-spondin-1 [Rhinatrema bivittatum]